MIEENLMFLFEKAEKVIKEIVRDILWGWEYVRKYSFQFE